MGKAFPSAEEKRRHRIDLDRKLQEFIFFQSNGQPTVRFYSDVPKRKSVCRICKRAILPGMGRLRLRVNFGQARTAGANRGAWFYEDYFFHAACVGRAADWSDGFHPRKCAGCWRLVDDVPPCDGTVPGRDGPIPKFPSLELRVGRYHWQRLPICGECAYSGQFVWCDVCYTVNYRHEVTTPYYEPGTTVTSERYACNLCADSLEDPSRPPATVREYRRRLVAERKWTQRFEGLLERVRARGLWA